MRPTARTVLRTLVVLTSVSATSTLVGAHGSDASTPDHGLEFGFVVALAVVLGVLGGAIVVRRRSSATGPPSTPSISILLVVLGCWAAVVAVLQGPGPALAAAIVALGAGVAWSLRNRVVGGHRGCDQAALGAVVLHRFVEGAFLATLYSADAAVGVGAALVLAAHTAAETGAVAGLWSTGRWRWGVVAVVQAGFVAGAFGGEVVAQYVTPLASVTVLALLGGALIATGVATSSSRQHTTHA